MTIEEKREKVKQALLLYGVTDRAWVGDKTFEGIKGFKRSN